MTPVLKRQPEVSPSIHQNMRKYINDYTEEFGAVYEARKLFKIIFGGCNNPFLSQEEG